MNFRFHKKQQKKIRSPRNSHLNSFDLPPLSRSLGIGSRFNQIRPVRDPHDELELLLLAFVVIIIIAGVMVRVRVSSSAPTSGEFEVRVRVRVRVRAGIRIRVSSARILMLFLLLLKAEVALLEIQKRRASFLLPLLLYWLPLVSHFGKSFLSPLSLSPPLFLSLGRGGRFFFWLLKKKVIYI